MNKGAEWAYQTIKNGHIIDGYRYKNHFYEIDYNSDLSIKTQHQKEQKFIDLLVMAKKYVFAK